jgi:hypothetical protein
MAAGVFGIARTIAVSARHDRDHHGCRTDQRCQVRQDLGRGLRLDRNDNRVGAQCVQLGIEPQPERSVAGDLQGRLGLQHNSGRRVETMRDPPVEHGGAHLSSADQDQRSGHIA